MMLLRLYNVVMLVVASGLLKEKVLQLASKQVGQRFKFVEGHVS
jgi:hypothetical protein